MFKDLFLSGGIAFDVAALLQTLTPAGEFQFAWLAATFLNFKHLLSLSNFMELKKQLVLFVDTDVIPALIYLGKQEDTANLIVNLCIELKQRAICETGHQMS